eukprot:TRINITY_DN10197_c0_g1_i8.p1 TRINITY_DN10197_c0_g1~~TRINITY_DN10197_c0_g1_i8.p1  ORF type:complete len:722 (-),score=198.47 TRINITY_DN10197_c0_g1_i8:104-2269(-)
MLPESGAHAEAPAANPEQHSSNTMYVARQAGVPPRNAANALRDCNGSVEQAIAKATRWKEDGCLEDERLARMEQGPDLAMRHGVNPERIDQEDNSHVKRVLSSVGVARGATTDRDKLVQLLEYAKTFQRLQGGQVEKELKEYAALEGGLVLVESQLQQDQVEGLHLNEDDGVWLRIERVAGKIQPPRIPDSLVPFVSGGQSVDHPPALRRRGVASPAPPKLEEEAKQFVHGEWKHWKDTEERRLQGESVYRGLFTLYQQMQHDGADKPMELIWGIGVARWSLAATQEVIDHPLIEIGVEVELCSSTGAILVRPKPSTKPQMRLQMFDHLNIAGLGPLRQQCVKILNNTHLNEQESDISPFRLNSYNAIIIACATQLATDGKVLPTQKMSKSPPESLEVVDSWAVYARERSLDSLVCDMEAMAEHIQQIPEGGELPPSAACFVRPPSGDLQRSAPNHPILKSDLLFPKPHNAAQVEVLRNLEVKKKHGVVVQGPPGTGKTHTIANIICHYLAKGKRILVTAKAEAPLSVIRSHLPEKIRSLVVSIISSEREGMRELQESVRTLMSRVGEIVEDQLQEQVDQASHKNEALCEQLAKIDANLEQMAGKWFKPLGESWGALQGVTTAAAVALLSKTDTQLIPDQLAPQQCMSTHKIDDHDMDRLRAARVKCMSVLGEIPDDSPEALEEVHGIVCQWKPDRLGEMHTTLQRARDCLLYTSPSPRDS